jgi:hypothetical protein
MNALNGLDGRKWFDRMLPQTLAVALWLLYIDGAFALVNFIDMRSDIGLLRATGGVNVLFAILSIAAYLLAGFLMANGKLLGWYVGIFAAFTPILSRFLAAMSLSDMGFDMSLKTRLMGADTIGFLFEAALIVLMLHPMSRVHARRWFR